MANMPAGKGWWPKNARWGFASAASFTFTGLVAMLTLGGDWVRLAVAAWTLAWAGFYLATAVVLHRRERSGSRPGG
jgi:uncharacterized membrane protein